MSGVLIGDAHVHFFERGFSGRYGRSPAGTGSEIGVYETLRDHHGIACTLVVGYEDAPFAAGNNTYIRDLASSRSWMATVAYVAPASNPTPDQIAGLLERGHRGVSLYVSDGASTDAMKAWHQETWEVLDVSQSIISLNITPDELHRSKELFAEHPGCQFLFSHLGLPGRHRSPPPNEEARRRIAGLLACGDMPNCWVKISGLYATSDPLHAFPHHTATPFVDAILDRYGTQRCVWGSDFSPALDHVSFAQAVSPPQLARLTPIELAAVMGGNLAALLG